MFPVEKSVSLILFLLTIVSMEVDITLQNSLTDKRSKLTIPYSLKYSTSQKLTQLLIPGFSLFLLFYTL